MPFTEDQLSDIIGKLSTKGQNLIEYRRAVASHQVTLSDEMASALGTPRRRSVPVLAVVVEAIANKLFVKDITTKATVKKQLDQWLKSNHWDLAQRKLWEAVARDGQGYVLVTPTVAPTPEEPPVRFTFREGYDGKEGAVTVYDEASGRVKYGVNFWKHGSAQNADFYFPDRIEKYTKPQEGKWSPRLDEGDAAWPVDWTDGDGRPLGVALIPFGDGCSDIEGALQLGKDINENLVDLMATSRSQGWPQRFLKGKDATEYMTNLNGQPLRNAAGAPIRRQIKLSPGSVMVLRGENSELGQLDGATPDPTLVEVYLKLLSWVTTVPVFYFTGDWPSGVALIQGEARLNHLAEAHQGQLTASVVAMVKLALRIIGVYTVLPLDTAAPVDVEWSPPLVETEDLIRERETATADLFAAGLMSLKQAIKRLHPDWTDEQVDQEVAAIEKEKKAAMPAPAVDPATGQAQDPAAQTKKDLLARAQARAKRTTG